VPKFRDSSHHPSNKSCLNSLGLRPLALYGRHLMTAHVQRHWLRFHIVHKLLTLTNMTLSKAKSCTLLGFVFFVRLQHLNNFEQKWRGPLFKPNDLIMNLELPPKTYKFLSMKFESKRSIFWGPGKVQAKSLYRALKGTLLTGTHACEEVELASAHVVVTCWTFSHGRNHESEQNRAIVTWG